MGNSAYQYYNTIISRTVTQAVTYPAWQISLQESCNPQALMIRSQLAAQGQNFSLFFGIASGGKSACGSLAVGPYGNAMMAIGTPLGSHYQILSPHAVPAEDKNIQCAVMQNVGFKTENCTTHTTASDGYLTAQQTDNARGIQLIQRVIDGAYSLSGTDLNIPYPIPPPVDQIGNMPQGFQNWWSDNTEAHMPNWWITFLSQTIPYDRMIDYIWADRRLFQQWGQYPCQYYGESDHRFCSAVFRIP